MKPHFKIIALVLIFSSMNIFSLGQERKDSANNDPTGYLSMGARNCVSVFIANGRAFAGTGAGGQFALHIAKDFNSHWFADWITSNVGNLAQRIDFHSGFSMMPEVFSKQAGKTHISFFPLAGFCIDYTKFSITSGKNVASGPTYLERYSFAAQAGIGTTIPISDNLDFSFEAHYMLHVGTDIDINLNGNEVTLIKHSGTSLDGHFLFAYSVDYKLFRLWRKKYS